MDVGDQALYLSISRVITEEAPLTKYVAAACSVTRHVGANLVEVNGGGVSS